jgi:hypothetical protein
MSLHLRPQLPVLQRVAGRQSPHHRRNSRARRGDQGGRQGLGAHAEVDCLRPSLRGDRRAVTAGRAGAGRAVRLAAGFLPAVRKLEAQFATGMPAEGRIICPSRPRVSFRHLAAGWPKPA